MPLATVIACNSEEAKIPFSPLKPSTVPEHKLTPAMSGLTPAMDDLTPASIAPEEKDIQDVIALFKNIKISTTDDKNKIATGSALNAHALNSLGLVLQNGNKFKFPSDLKGTTVTYNMPNLNGVGTTVTGNIVVSKGKFLPQKTTFSVTEKTNNEKDVEAVAAEFNNINIYKTYDKKIDAVVGQPLSMSILSNMGQVTRNGHAFAYPSDLKGTIINYDVNKNYDIQPDQGKITISKTDAITQKVDSKTVAFTIQTQPYELRKTTDKAYQFNLLLTPQDIYRIMYMDGPGTDWNVFYLYDYLTSQSSGEKDHINYADTFWTDLNNTKLSSEFLQALQDAVSTPGTANYKALNDLFTYNSQKAKENLLLQFNSDKETVSISTVSWK